MSPNVITFLRKEGKRMYRELDPVMKRLTSPKELYVALKQAWKDGNKLSKDERDKATSVNYKEFRENNA